VSKQQVYSSPSSPPSKLTLPSPGEIAYAYPKLSTTMLSGSTRLLTRLRPAVGIAAESQLSKLGVPTKHDLRVVSTHQEADKTIVTLSDNSTTTVDVYIDATGPVPNSSWLPPSWLTPSHRVQTDLQTLRTPTSGVYAIGDVGHPFLASFTPFQRFREH